jgi:hypothetical protein
VSADLYARAKAVFQQAIAEPDAGRAAFLERACGGDAELRGEVEALLAAHARVGGVLDGPALDLLADAALTSIGEELAAGQRVGPYEVVRRLGAGGMGEVYLAQDPRLGRRVALKLLPPASGARRDRVQRFAKEARAAAQLSHQNICHVYEVGEASGQRFIAMEYVEGETLRQRLAGGRCRWRRRWRWECRWRGRSGRRTRRGWCIGT